jgi:hypothetical protein
MKEAVMKLATILALTCFAGAAQAGDGDWTYRTTLYLWFPGMSASVNTPVGDFNADMSASEALSNLKFGFMGTVAAEKDNWILWGDLLYTNLAVQSPTPHGSLWGESEVNQKLTAVTGYALYNVTPGSDTQFALGAGARWFDVQIDGSLTGGSAAPVNTSGGATWAVPVLAAQVYAPISGNWFVNGLADWGMTSSDTETWQVYAGVGYRFNAHWSTQAGYRVMDFQKSINGNPVQTDLSGIVAGVTYEF